MKKIKDSTLDDYEKPLFRRGWYIGSLSLVLVSAFVLFILNAAKLQIELNRSTQGYLADVASQLSRDVRDAINNKTTNLVTTADSLSRFTERQDADTMSDLLNHAAQILEFKPLIFFDREDFFVPSQTDGSEPPVSLEDSLKLPSARASLQGSIQTSYISGEGIFYSVPVYRNGGVNGVLVGVRSKENTQSSISFKSFNGQMLSCIVDSQGQIITSPTDLKPFLQLGDIFRQEKNEKIIIDIQKMQWDMTKNRSGVPRFTATAKEELLLSYNALNIDDRSLFTIIPTDIIPTRTDQYILQPFIIIGVTVSIFSLFLSAVFRSYNVHKRQLELIVHRDPLIGGFSNATFQVRYRELLKDMTLCTYSIVFLNVRGLRMISEQSDTRIDNQILSYIHRVLRQHLREEQDEFVAKDESNHFSLCLKEYSPGAIQYRLNDMTHGINNLHDMELPDLSLSFKQGAYLADDSYQEVTLLQDHTRIALQGCGIDLCHSCCLYDESPVRALKIEQELSALFEDSVENRYSQTYLQPKIELRSGRLEGAEALVHWNHP